MSAEQPLPEVFCMQCGPGTVLRRDGQQGLRCPRCGAVQQVPALPLFVVTGASGTGKTTITGPLSQRLPDFEVFDADIILHVAALGGDNWRNTWLQLAHAIALNGRATVLLSSWLPAQLDQLPARALIGPIHFCNLDCPDDVLAARLGSRPARRGTSSREKIAEHQRFAAWLRAHIRPSFDTCTLSVDETADHVAAWSRALLSADAGYNGGFAG
jgi:gluconate kinase